MNMFSHWFLPFASDGWNQLDVVVVSLSLMALGPVTMPANVMRVVRALRVVRLFGRMQSLRNILGALSKSILPVSNALLVLFIVASICESFPSPRSLHIKGVDSRKYVSAISVNSDLFLAIPCKTAAETVTCAALRQIHLILRHLLLFTCFGVSPRRIQSDR
jgi:hypothetical protein